MYIQCRRIVHHVVILPLQGWPCTVRSCHVFFDVVSTVCVYLYCLFHFLQRYCTFSNVIHIYNVHYMYNEGTLDCTFTIHLLYIVYCKLYCTLYCTWNVHDHLMSCASNVRAMHITCTFTVQLTTTLVHYHSLMYILNRYSYIKCTLWRL